MSVRGKHITEMQQLFLEAYYEDFYQCTDVKAKEDGLIEILGTDNNWFLLDYAITWCFVFGQLS